MPAVFMKGQTFRTVVGVYLRMKYPEDNIVSQPYMCEVVDENGETQYSDRADFEIPSQNLIIEVKWGHDTFKINKHYERQQGLLKEDQKYEGICMVENHGLPKEFVSFEKIISKLEAYSSMFSQKEVCELLLETVKNLAKSNSAVDLKYLRNVLHSIYKEQDFVKFKSKI